MRVKKQKLLQSITFKEKQRRKKKRKEEATYHSFIWVFQVDIWMNPTSSYCL